MFAMFASFLWFEFYILEDAAGNPRLVRFDPDDDAVFWTLSGQALADAFPSVFAEPSPYAASQRLCELLQERGWYVEPVQLPHLTSLMHHHPGAFSNAERAATRDLLLRLLEKITPDGLQLGLRAAKNLCDTVLDVRQSAIPSHPDALCRTAKEMLNQNDVSLIGLYKATRDHRIAVGDLRAAHPLEETPCCD